MRYSSSIRANPLCFHVSLIPPFHLSLSLAPSPPDPPSLAPLIPPETPPPLYFSSSHFSLLTSSHSPTPGYHTLIHIHKYTHTHALAHTHTLLISLSVSLSVSLSRFLSLSLSLVDTHTHMHTHTHAQTFTSANTFSPMQDNRSLSLTHTLTHRWQCTQKE